MRWGYIWIFRQQLTDAGGTEYQSYGVLEMFPPKKTKVVIVFVCPTLSDMQLDFSELEGGFYILCFFKMFFGERQRWVWDHTAWTITERIGNTHTHTHWQFAGCVLCQCVIGFVKTLEYFVWRVSSSFWQVWRFIDWLIVPGLFLFDYI